MDVLFFKDSVFEMLGAISSLMIAYGVLILYIFARKKERRERVEYASRYIQKWNEPEFFHRMARLFNDNNVDLIRQLQPASYDAFRVNSKTGFDDVVNILNFMEDLAQSIESGLADEYTLRRYFQQPLVETYKILEPFVQITRTQKYNPSAFRSTERLIGSWSFSEPLGE
ncbi:DUF4760 domain-containing protein [Vibrio cholerae]|uniref:DUF4760 domain-containing protein n=1 Tax=Vibrio vulnificus TaxID=672 RepID=A0AAW4HAN8_VIBVL|nr:DUF4760 domain-containing protein [Vibrio vulnificus]EHZ7431665.1 DUF4760 domain-containing protein [Vibrio cholerae]HCG9584473.1 DUF4760 domain-containing protein [Vibrio parahaemolyticus]EJL6364777.1 DUF4760 domain-containing protein [Vibrio cholerae]ELF1354407.1 DUF4760 domain-containing protein [Vibrio cholerae]MBN8122299.1 DUF4760 domain-containing protein [Vibrio vulnificus]